MSYELQEVSCKMKLGPAEATQGLRIGSFTVTLGWHGFHGFTEGTYDVCTTDLNGLSVRISTYSDFQIACQFAESLNRDFGNLAERIERARDGKSSQEDQRVWDAIHLRKLHPTRLIGGALIPAGDAYATQER